VVLRNLIDETLQIQEAKSAGVDVDDDEVNQTYERVAQQNFGQNPAALDKYLVSIGSSPASLKRQILRRAFVAAPAAPQCAAVHQRLRRRSEEMMERLKAAKGTEEYRIGEIYLSANDQNRSQVMANANQIVEQLKKGGSFVAYARQYSEASTAAVGGDLGWICLAQLPQDLANVANSMQPGQLAGPIEISRRLFDPLPDRQAPGADRRSARRGAQPQADLAHVPQGHHQGRRRQGRSLRLDRQDHPRLRRGRCRRRQAGRLGRHQRPGQGTRPAGRLAGSDAQAVDRRSHPPFGSIEDGVRVLMLCGRDDPKVSDGPSFEEMQSQMEDDRVNKRAQTYLRDLRRDAVIEYN
jgi:peptidyl-prolyl cis-trans isomerase SurA